MSKNINQEIISSNVYEKRAKEEYMKVLVLCPHDECDSIEGALIEGYIDQTGKYELWQCKKCNKRFEIGVREV